jgi:hypothetical protein
MTGGVVVHSPAQHINHPAFADLTRKAGEELEPVDIAGFIDVGDGQLFECQLGLGFGSSIKKGGFLAVPSCVMFLNKLYQDFYPYNLWQLRYLAASHHPDGRPCQYEGHDDHSPFRHGGDGPWGRRRPNNFNRCRYVLRDGNCRPRR